MLGTSSTATLGSPANAGRTNGRRSSSLSRDIAVNDRKENQSLRRDQRRPERDALVAARDGSRARGIGRARRGLEIQAIERVSEGCDSEADEHRIKALERAQLRHPRASYADRDKCERQDAAHRSAERRYRTGGDGSGLRRWRFHAAGRVNSVAEYGVKTQGYPSAYLRVIGYCRVVSVGGLACSWSRRRR